MLAESAIRRVTRDVVVTWLIHAVLFLVVLVILFIGPSTGLPSILLVAIPCTVWVLLAFNGMREARNAMQWPTLIASGQLQEAERQIEQAIRGFSMLRSMKLLSLHQLAVLRMAQGNWADAARLSHAILTFRWARDASLQRASLLVLAGSSVRIGAMEPAYGAIGQLRLMPLTLDEQLALLSAETAYLARIGAWSSLVHAIDQKARMAELMPADAAAQTQAYLALGARREGRRDWETYLTQRCMLLEDPARLCEQDGILRELFSPAGQKVEVASGPKQSNQGN